MGKAAKNISGISLKSSDPAGRMSFKRKISAAFLALILVSVLLLFLLPGARDGTKVLINRLFDMSEAVNAYSYAHFETVPDQPVGTAVVLWGLILFGLTGIACSWREPVFLLLCAALTASVQAYFGLSLPAWVNVSIFSLLGLLLMRGKRTPGSLVFYTVVIGLCIGVILTQYPGVDSWIENQSELVRDRLTRSAVPAGGLSGTESDELIETRHVNSRSLISGEGESQTQREFQLITKDQEQISLPEWAEPLADLLPFILIAVFAVFLCFLLGKAVIRSRKAASERRLFYAEDRSAAVCAMFRYITDRLEAFGYGAGNVPFREWPVNLADKLSEAYAASFSSCVPVFESALYSGKQTAEEDWTRVMELLEETEALKRRPAAASGYK